MASGYAKDLSAVLSRVGRDPETYGKRAALDVLRIADRPAVKACDCEGCKAIRAAAERIGGAE